MMTLPTKTEARNLCFRAKINPGYLIRIIRAVLVGGTLIRLGVRALSFMIQYQLKLKLTPRQERQLNHWLRHLAAVWNWGLRKVELDGCSRFTLQKLIAGHAQKIGIPSHVLQATLADVRRAWDRCFAGLAHKPRFKGFRNKLNSIPLPDPIRIWPGKARAGVLGIGRVRYHKQEVPAGKIKCGRIVKKASGWYLCLFIDAEPNPVLRVADGQIGIDPGFNHLLTLSTGEKVNHPRELEASALRLAQAQRGSDKALTARLHERIRNQRKDRNHKLSRRLVSENVFIAFSKDRISSIARRFGKSVTSSGHFQLRQMLAYKSPTSGTRYVEPDSKNSTKRCSACGLLTGPTGLAGLSVRRWVCCCGAEHDRDQNAGMNALIAGAGIVLERKVA